MVEEETKTGPLEGLHARPAAEFVQTAKSFSSEIVFRKESHEANAKSSLMLMALGAKHGDSIAIRAEDDDAQEAVAALVKRLSIEE